MSNSPFPGAATEATTPRKHFRDSIRTTTVEMEDSIAWSVESWVRSRTEILSYTFKNMLHISSIEFDPSIQDMYML